MPPDARDPKTRRGVTIRPRAPHGTPRPKACIAVGDGVAYGVGRVASRRAASPQTRGRVSEKDDSLPVVAYRIVRKYRFATSVGLLIVACYIAELNNTAVTAELGHACSKVHPFSAA